MKKYSYFKIQKFLFLMMGFLAAVLLSHLFMVPNTVTETNRKIEGYEVVDDVQYKKTDDADAPAGVRREFSFKLKEEIEYDTTLIFKFSHQNAEVYLDNEKVYELRVSDEVSVVKTPGTNWAMIPLYREDLSKEVRIVLTPVYQGYQDQNIRILIGSKYAVYKAEFMKAFPELALSTINILIGVCLFFIALYFMLKKVEGSGFFTLASLAISLGLWNFTQTDFAPFIMQDKTVFLYSVSVTMLMICIIPLVKSIKKIKGKLSEQVLEIWCIVCCIISIAELLIQIFGILDLREMLKVTHMMILVSSLVLIFRSQMEWFSSKKNLDEESNPTFVWMIGVGALLDLLLYYMKGSTFGLLFVLLSIFAYVLMEGIRIFSSYVQQKQILEEKEIQLTLSRITTMMSQIRSHFVFNILNAISGMCKYDPEKADETVVRFSRYLRNNIDIMEDDKPILFSTELVHLEDYVVLEQVRFGDKIEFYSDIKVEHFLIPPLVLQPIVENAIKHGLTKKQSGGTVILRTWEEGENIKISVEDDGLGFELSELEKEKSVGLKNIRYRLYHLMHGSVDIKTQPGIGTTVTITIPKKEAEPCESFM